MAAPTLERKTVDFAVKAMGEELPGTFSIYAAAFGNIDRANEKIAKGAFKNLEDFKSDGFLALNHDWKELPLGTIDTATQDDYGLRLDGTFHSTIAAQDARTVMRERMQRRKSVKLSIGYEVTDDAKMTENGKAYRLLKSINIFEASYVNVPANERAIAVNVKEATMSTAAKEMTEGEDTSGGATVPADEGSGKPTFKCRKGMMVKWKAYGKDVRSGCGMVKSVHTKGVVPGVENDAEASEDTPHARIHLHKKNDDGKYEPMGDRHQAHAVKHLTQMKVKGSAAIMEGEAEDKSIGAITIKGKYLGDTDEMMACAALDRLNSSLYYYLMSCIRSDKTVEATLEMAKGAIDEYKDTALKLLDVLLEDDDDADEGIEVINYPMAAESVYGSGYGYRSIDAALPDRLATKYLAALASFDTSRDNSVTALSLEARSHSVVSALGEIRDLGRKFADVRLKEGRMLSTATRGRIQAALEALKPLVSDLEALVDESAPKPKEVEDGEESSESTSTKGTHGGGQSKADPAAVLRAQQDFAQFQYLQIAGQASL